MESVSVLGSAIRVGSTEVEGQKSPTIAEFRVQVHGLAVVGFGFRV